MESRRIIKKIDYIVHPVFLLPIRYDETIQLIDRLIAYAERADNSDRIFIIDEGWGDDSIGEMVEENPEIFKGEARGNLVKG